MEQLHYRENGYTAVEIAWEPKDDSLTVTTLDRDTGVMRQKTVRSGWLALEMFYHPCIYGLIEGELEYVD